MPNFLDNDVFNSSFEPDSNDELTVSQDSEKYMPEEKILKDEQYYLASNPVVVEGLKNEGWDLIKTYTTVIKKKDSEDTEEVPTGFLMRKIYSPVEFQISEIKWTVKDAIRGRHTKMSFGGQLQLDIHNYNMELVKVATKIRHKPDEEFKELTEQDWSNLGSRCGDKVLTAVRMLNEPSDEDMRNLLQP